MVDSDQIVSVLDVTVARNKVLELEIKSLAKRVLFFFILIPYSRSLIEAVLTSSSKMLGLTKAHHQAA